MPQPFIFQFICIQLCKTLNCFFKTYNKQLNQYCHNFIIFLHKKGGIWKKVWVTGWVAINPKKNRGMSSVYVLRSGALLIALNGWDWEKINK